MSYSIYKVKSQNGLKVRSGSSTTSSVLRVLPFGTVVNAYDSAKGNEAGKTVTWVKINASKGEWCCQTYLSFIKTVFTGTIPKATATAVAVTTATNLNVENNDTVASNGASAITITGNTDANYQTLLNRYLSAMGCPPTFTEEVDPCYYSGFGDTVGHEVARSLFSNPSILSICPGTVDYLPGFTSKDKDKFFNQVAGLAAGNPDVLKNLPGSATSNDKIDGKLYEFKAAYNDYINTVNPMCRMASILLGIGDQNMPGTNIALKNFDYGYWTTPESQSGAFNNGHSIFTETWMALNTAVSDKHYIHFFVNHQGTSISEDMQTQTAASSLEGLFNGSNGSSSLSGLARDLQFLFGGAIGSSDAGKDIDTLLGQAGDKGDFVSSFVKLTANYLKGGRLVFPEMVGDISYNKSISCSLKFVSPYAKKLSVFLRCYVPAIHLLSFMLPKQISQNMYTYPFLCRVTQKGRFNSDLAVMTDLKLTRGGSDDTSWSVDGLTTEIEASFNITPLYSNLIVPNAQHPFLMMQNTSIMEYLGNLCGVDLKLNNLDAKVQIAKAALQNKFTDAPTNLVRGFIDNWALAEIKKFAQIQD